MTTAHAGPRPRAAAGPVRPPDASVRRWSPCWTMRAPAAARSAGRMRRARDRQDRGAAARP